MLFAGVVSSVLAGSSTSLLLAFVLPVTLRGSPSSIPDRLGGWGNRDAYFDIDPEAAVRVRPSQIEGFRRCPLRWVLGAMGAEAAPDSSRTVGTAVHAVAQRVADGLPPEEAPTDLDAELDTLDLGPGWADQRQRTAAHDMLETGGIQGKLVMRV